MAGVLYRREREMLEFIAHWQRMYGYSPTLREMADGTGHKSVSTIHVIIRNLVEKGYLQKVDGNARVLKILDPNIVNPMMGLSSSIELPLMGYIAAGRPLEPHTDPNATFQISASLLSGKHTAYVLQVKGESMIDEGIMDGDYVVIERQPEVRNGDIVVALVDDNLATLKMFFKEGEQVILKPANAKMDPIYPRTVKIQGKAVGLVRRF